MINQQGPLIMPCFAKPFAFWILICLLLLLQLFKLLWIDIGSSLGMNFSQTGHGQADFNGQVHQFLPRVIAFVI